MTYTEKPRSNAWYLLPIFVGMIGGIIGYLIIRKDDRVEQKLYIHRNCNDVNWYHFQYYAIRGRCSGQSRI